jgi:hypothetical protein
LQSASNIQRPVLLFVFYASTRVHRRTVRDAFFFTSCLPTTLTSILLHVPHHC